MRPFDTSPPKMVHTLRALACVLRYPDAEFRAAVPEIVDALRAERALSAERLAEIEALLAQLARGAAMQVESEYVDLFDRSRRNSLHLFEHVHGDSRDRGQAMVDLALTYERAGLLMAPGELPDYLPLVLEFASTQPPAQAREFLRETAHIVRAIFSALVERGSAYAAALGAVLDLAGERCERVAVAAEPALDETWAEPEAFAGCSSAGQTRADAPQPIHIVRGARSTASTPTRT